MSQTTGILTLSVHEALTFDGTEIALHPDLFASGSNSTNASTAGGAAVTAGGNEDDAAAAAAAAAAALLTPPPPRSKGQQAVTQSTQTTPSTAGPTSTRPSPASTVGQVGLEVGDAIEVRVWTPKPSGGLHHFGHGAAHHHRKHSSIGQNSTFRTVPAHGNYSPKVVSTPLTSVSSVVGGGAGRAAAATQTTPIAPSPPPSVVASHTAAGIGSSNLPISSPAVGGGGGGSAASNAHSQSTSDRLHGTTLLGTPVSVLTAATPPPPVPASAAQAQAQAQRQLSAVRSQSTIQSQAQTPPVSPSATSANGEEGREGGGGGGGGGGESSTTIDSFASILESSSGGAASTSGEASSRAMGRQIVRQIPMRREGSSGAGAVEPSDIITPLLHDSAAGGGGGGGSSSSHQQQPSTNPQDGIGIGGGSGTAGGGERGGAVTGGLQSTSSSLSSSPLASLVAPTSTSSMLSATLPPLPPSRQPSQLSTSRSRANTADSIGTGAGTSAGGDVGGGGGGLMGSKAGGSKQHPQQQLSAPLEAPETPITSHGNRARINTLPADVAKSAQEELSRQLKAAAPTMTSPKSLAGAQSSKMTATAAGANAAAPAPVPLLAGKVDGEPGHIRDISKLSVGSDFADASSALHGGHVRESSSLSSVVGEHLVTATTLGVGEDDPLAAMAASRRKGQQAAATPGSSGRVARSLMLRGAAQGQTIAPPPAHRSHLPTEANEKVDTLSLMAETHDLRTKFVMLVTKKTLSSIKSSARTQVSILRQVADLYNLSPYDQVTVTKVAKEDRGEVLEEISADFILVTFKDQFISRGEMYHFQNSLVGRWLYEGVRLDSSADGIRANATEIRHGDHQALSGVVTEDTKVTFRSRSTRIIWLVQISSEMWDYASPYETKGGTGGSNDPGDDGNSCEIYFDKFVTFMHRLFEKWKDLEVTHSLTVVFFSRTYLQRRQQAAGAHASRSSSLDKNFNSTSAISSEADGRVYEDHYKMVVENDTRHDWITLVHKIKKAFVSYPIEVGWKLDSEASHVPSTAAQGNLLEAINITLNLLQFHYMDRDLHRTGNSIVVVSAGCGVFEVDKGLASITKERMMANGIGSDMLSLTLPPLHVAPFFLYKDVDDSSNEETPDFDDWKGYFEIPHWMHLSYFNYDDESDVCGGNGGTSFRSTTLPSISSRLPGDHTYLNGFIVRGPDMMEAVNTLSPALEVSRRVDSGVAVQSSHHPQTSGRSRSQKQQRHLITSRDFEDILEACRPRNRGESFSMVPSALALLVPSSEEGTRDKAATESSQGNGTRFEDATPRESSGIMHAMQQRSMRKSSDLHTVSEWGAVDFNEIGDSLINIAKGAPSAQEFVESDPALNLMLAATTDSISGSDKSASPSSSSFSSHYSYLLGRSVDRSPDYLTNTAHLRVGHDSGRVSTMQIQPSSDLNLPLLGKADGQNQFLRSRSNRSDDSLSTMASGELLPAEEKGDIGYRSPSMSHSVETLRKLMSTHDSGIFSPPKNGATSSHHRNGPTSTGVPPPPPTLESPSMRLAHNKGTLSPLGEQMVPSKRLAASAHAEQVGGGIGAALHHFDGVSKAPPMKKMASAGRLDRFLPIPALYGGPSSYTRLHDDSGGKTTVSPSMLESVGMPMGSDPPDRIRPSAYARVSNYSTQSTDVAPSDRGLASGLGRSAVPSSTAVAHKAPLLADSGGNAKKSHESHRERGNSTQHRNHSPIKSSSSQHTNQHQHHSHHKHNHHHHHHHHRHASKHKGKGKSKQNRGHHPVPSAPAPPSHQSRRKAWVLNPFRQEDEDEVLAKRTHNRRRWSHVFPPGEIEFKRHAGPNWKSLCQPAILPTTIDYYPSPQELNDPVRFQFSHYSVSLDAMDRTDYRSHSELLREMVRQRLIQDFQMVPHSIIKQSTHRGETDRKGMFKGGALALVSNRSRMPPSVSRPYPSSHWPSSSMGENSIQQTYTLSMGHRIQLLSYNPLSDAIEVVSYYSRFATNDPANNQLYHYNLWCPVLQRYTRVTQEFRKYADEYLWNKVDTLICGEAEMKLFEGSRFRRIMFRIIPDNDSKDPAKEAEYVKKFQRLLEYISKQLLKEAGLEQMGIKIVTSSDVKADDTPNVSNVRQRATDNFKHFRVPLRKGSTEKYQWMEMVMDSTFDTSHTYKIMLHWLVASAIKVEAQVQLLQRRCAQYGLRLVSFPQDSISSGVQLHSFIAPILIPIRDKDRASAVEQSVHVLGFFDDGSVLMESKELEENGGLDDYNFPKARFGRRPRFSTKQYVHQSGTLFFRVVRDVDAKAIVIVYENRRYINGDDGLTKTAREIFVQLKNHIG